MRFLAVKIDICEPQLVILWQIECRNRLSYYFILRVMD